MEFDVFISYHTNSTKSITEAIVNNLESKGIRCWYAPRNVEGNYAQSIVKAINKCRVFLLILNKEASYSEDVLNEINLAIERLRKKENVAFLPFHITDEEISDDAKYYLSRIHWIDAIDPPMERRIDELATRILYILGIQKEENKTDIILKGIEHFSLSYFVGRNEELERIENSLQTTGRVILEGMGGIGKSEIAKYYAYQHKDKYTKILFAVYETNIKNMVLDNKYFPLTNFERKQDEFGNQESNESYFQRKLQKIAELVDSKTLLIIDNYDTNYDEDFEKILDLPWTIIITTRNDLKKYSLPIIKIESLNDNDLLNIFKENYTLPVKEEEVIIKIINILGRHTLATILVASIMKESRIKPTKMLENLQKMGISNDIEADIYYKKHEYNSLYECFKALFKLSLLTEQEKQILMDLSFFGINGISFEKFMDLASLNSGLDINHLIKNSFVLYDYVKDTISLHPIINSLVEKELKPDLDNCHTLITNIANSYNRLLPFSVRKEYENVILSIYQKYPHIKKEFINEYLQFANTLMDCFHLDLAWQISEEVTKICDDIDLKIEGYAKMAYIKVLEDNAMEASKIMENVVKLLPSIQKTPLIFAKALMHISFYKVENKEYKEALDYENKYYNILKENNALTDEIIGNYYIHLAKINFGLKEYDQALDNALESYKYLIKLGENEEEIGDISTVFKIIGQIYIEQKDFLKAKEYIEKSYNIKKKFFTPEALSLLRIREMLATVDIELNNLLDAKSLLEENIAILDNYYIDCDSTLNRLKDKMAKIEKLTNKKS